MQQMIRVRELKGDHGHIDLGWVDYAFEGEDGLPKVDDALMIGHQYYRLLATASAVSHKGQPAWAFKCPTCSKQFPYELGALAPVCHGKFAVMVGYDERYQCSARCQGTAINPCMLATNRSSR